MWKMKRGYTYKLTAYLFSFFVVLTGFLVLGQGHSVFAIGTIKNCYPASCDQGPSTSGNQITFSANSPQTQTVAGRTYTLSCWNSQMSSTSGGVVTIGNDIPSNSQCTFQHTYYSTSGPYDVSGQTQACYLDPDSHTCTAGLENETVGFGSITVQAWSSPAPPPPSSGSYSYGVSINPNHGGQITSMATSVTTDNPGYSSATIYYDGSFICNIGASKSGACTSLGGNQGSHTVRADFANGGSATTTYTVDPGQGPQPTPPPSCPCGSFLSCNNNGVPGDGSNPSCSNPTYQCYGVLSDGSCGGGTNSVTGTLTPDPVLVGNSVTVTAVNNASSADAVFIWYQGNPSCLTNGPGKWSCGHDPSALSYFPPPGFGADVTCSASPSSPGSKTTVITCPIPANATLGQYHWYVSNGTTSEASNGGSSYNGTIVDGNSCNDPKYRISPNTGPIGTQITISGWPAGNYQLGIQPNMSNDQELFSQPNYASWSNLGPVTMGGDSNHATWTVTQPPINPGRFVALMFTTNINAPWSGQTVTCPFTPTATPVAPGAFDFTSSTGTVCTSGTPHNDIYWTQSSGADTYSLWRSDPNGPGSYIATLASWQTSFADYNVTPGVVYTYILYAQNSVGFTQTSTFDKVITTSTCGPAGITLDPPTTSCSGSPAKPTVYLAWSSAGPGVTYSIHRQDYGFILTDWFGGGYPDSTVNQGTNYTYYIEAKDSSGLTTDSNTQSITSASCDGIAPPDVNISGGPTAACYSPTTWAGETPIKVIANDDPGGSGIKSVAVLLYEVNSPSDTLVKSYPTTFTGGYWQTAPGVPQASDFTSGQSYYLRATATDNANNTSAPSIKTPVFVWSNTATGCLNPFLNTTLGDVHSNTKIDTRGGQ